MANQAIFRKPDQRRWNTCNKDNLKANTEVKIFACAREILKGYHFSFSPASLVPKQQTSMLNASRA